MSDAVPPPMPPRNVPPSPSGGTRPSTGGGGSNKGLIIGCIVAVVVGLVIVAIIGVLAAVALPAITEARKRAQESISESKAGALKSAILTYYADYLRWPVQGGEDKDLEMRSEGALIETLMGKDSQSGADGLNPDGTVYYYGQVPNVPGAGPTVTDAWGHPFFIILDTNSDNEVQPANWPERVPDQIAIWSAGPDGDVETWEDNVTSW